MNKYKTACILLLILGFTLGYAYSNPPLGWTTHAYIDRVIDGDTVVVELRKKLHVRLIDCWAPEVRGPTRIQGLESKTHLISLIGDNQVLILHIPGDDNLSKLFTLNRALGYLWIKGDEKSLNQKMVESGYATKTKQ